MPIPTISQSESLQCLYQLSANQRVYNAYTNYQPIREFTMPIPTISQSDSLQCLYQLSANQRVYMYSFSHLGVEPSLINN
jgi:hypothetical protein